MNENVIVVQSVLTAALEAGVTTFLFNDPNATLAHDWSQLAKFTAIAVDGNTIRDQPCNKKVLDLSFASYRG